MSDVASNPPAGNIRPGTKRLSAWFWAACALTILKLWLTNGQTLFAIGDASYDDRLFLNLATALLRGEWLGSYNSLTLAKGPFYPLWVAFVFLLGVPLRQAEQLLYAGACALTVRALAPLVKNGWGRLGLYALLLWNPMSFDTQELGRVMRQNIYPPLTLILFAAMIALYVRRGESWRRLAPWAATLGLAWAAFWLTREESIWIAPSLILLGAAVIIGAWRHSPAALLNVGRVAVIATLCALAPILTICALNARYYGWFGTVEFRARAFKDAFGALLRVRPEEEIPFVPVTRATRERIYAVSPAFAELKPQLEGNIGRNWASVSSFLTHRRPEEREIAVGWFMWALRQTVEEMGHGRNARDALAFYEQIAREVNQACDDGRLPAGPHRSGFMPPWREGQILALARTFLEFANQFESFNRFNAHTPGSVGSASDLDYFRDVIRTRLSPPTQALGYEYVLPYQKRLDGWKVDVLHRIGKTLRHVLLALVWAAQVLWLVRAGQLIWRRQLTYPFVLAVAAWGGCAACLLVCALVQVTSFPTLSIVYFAPAYPLLLLFVAAVLLDTVGAWTHPASDASI
jgi:hypothetical protein